MPPLSIMIKPASAECNMRCRYCFYSDVAKNRSCRSMGFMSDATLENLVRRAFCYAEHPVCFAFQGGEPTLAGVDFYRNLIALQKKYNARRIPVQNTIQTNGYHMDDELLDVFEENNFLVGISFDGTPELHDLMRVDPRGHGTSAAVRDTIKKLRDRKIEYNILSVVTSEMAKHPREVFNYMQPHRFLQFIPCIDPFGSEESTRSLTTEEYTYFLNQIFTLYYHALLQGTAVSIRLFDNYVSILMGGQPEMCSMCGRCAQYYTIEADGSVYPCDFYVLDQWRMGNINEDSFFRLQNSPVSERFRAESLRVHPTCTHCPWLNLCRGGCRRDREAGSMGEIGPNRWCECYRTFFETNILKLKQLASLRIHNTQRGTPKRYYG